MSATISEKIVAALPSPPKGNRLHYFSGATLQGKKAPAGFAVRVTSAGTKSFVWFHRVAGRPYLETLGRWDENAKGGSLTVLKAIVAAKEREEAVGAKGEDPRPERTRRLTKPASETVAAMLDEFVDRYVKKEAKLRSAKNIERTFERLIKPAIGSLGLYDVRRSHVVRMLDMVADENGPVMADRTLALFRSACSWHAARDDDFHPPITRRMAKTKPAERARTRILADDEIRDLWAALDDVPARYAAFVRTILLTATRRTEAGLMQWGEINDGIWTIPGARYKTGTDHQVPLTDTVHALIGERPKDFAQRPFVFSATDGKSSFGDHSRAKDYLDQKIAELRAKDGREPMPGWVLHDLRRTARSLMSRAGISSDIAERALGHVIDGVRAVYDRHSYLQQKEQAFHALELLIEKILHPAPNVTEFADHRRAGG